MPGKFTGPSRTNSKNGGRFPSKTPERQKSELFKKVENLEKDNKEIKETMEELKEILKGKVINGCFVEEDVIVDMKYMNAGAPRMMLIDITKFTCFHFETFVLKDSSDVADLISSGKRFHVTGPIYLQLSIPWCSVLALGISQASPLSLLRRAMVFST